MRKKLNESIKGDTKQKHSHINFLISSTKISWENVLSVRYSYLLLFFSKQGLSPSLCIKAMHTAFFIKAYYHICCYYHRQVQQHCTARLGSPFVHDIQRGLFLHSILYTQKDQKLKYEQVVHYFKPQRKFGWIHGEKFHHENTMSTISKSQHLSKHQDA